MNRLNPEYWNLLESFIFDILKIRGTTVWESKFLRFESLLVIVLLSNKISLFGWLLWLELDVMWIILLYTICKLVSQESLKIAFYSFFEISAVVGVSVSNYNLVQMWIKFGIRGYYALCFIIYDPIRWFVFDYIWILSNIIKILIIRCDPVC